MIMHAFHISHNPNERFMLDFVMAYPLTPYSTNTTIRLHSKSCHGMERKSKGGGYI